MLAAFIFSEAARDVAARKRAILDHHRCRFGIILRRQRDQFPHAECSQIPSGDIVIAGHNLGRGHAHYYTAAVMACKEAGIAAILCEDVNALFQRAAIDQGFLIWSCPGISQMATSGDEIEVDLHQGSVINYSRNERKAIAALPKLVADIIDAGGSLDWALRRVGASRAA